jgi:uncharacterized membrane protein YjjB (DUF3815 family)
MSYKKLGRMKIQFDPSELLSAITFGVALGILSFVGHQKWRSLGREAYLAHYAQYFDKHYAHQPSIVASLIAAVILALVVLAIFKCLAFVYSKILSALKSKSATSPT